MRLRLFHHHIKEDSSSTSTTPKDGGHVVCNYTKRDRDYIRILAQLGCPEEKKRWDKVVVVLLEIGELLSIWLQS